jgi:hypothetical protein
MNSDQECSWARKGRIEAIPEQQACQCNFEKCSGIIWHGLVGITEIEKFFYPEQTRTKPNKPERAHGDAAPVQTADTSAQFRLPRNFCFHGADYGEGGRTSVVLPPGKLFTIFGPLTARKSFHSERIDFPMPISRGGDAFRVSRKSGRGRFRKAGRCEVRSRRCGLK